MSGVALAPVTYVKGTQTGWSIGLVNYARTLEGVQIGLINIAGSGGLARVLPLFNKGR
jgi:hypothetical protein